ncbi:Ectopic P granules protein 3 [Toxocara canis]|uniref:Ectopic P granules protein 3 n=1 Tax=Toxocara canis TaxID=6265 RepID=A0A0B2VEF5_TOXCA|nr:Ectopic P granules protein 3 [Toxocara canis]
MSSDFGRVRESSGMGRKKRNNNYGQYRVLDESTNGGSGSLRSSPSSSSMKQVTFDGSSKQSGDYYIKPSGRGMVPSPSVNTLNRLERRRIVLWSRPIQTTYYAVREILQLLIEFTYYLWRHKIYVALTLATCAALIYGYHVPGVHQKYVRKFEKRILLCLYWIGLGVLSSVGLGTGLHTFILYLGPHIASVTLAAYECNSLDFPEPPYPDRIICPHDDNGIMGKAVITLWAIMSKVRFESLMWGAGTALGELPPYFMAKAARISGEEPDDEEYREFIAYLKSTRPKDQGPSFSDRLRNLTEKIVSHVGFPGILIFASVPNPFFDLAGITCGHFLVPFWTFFGATLIGKAIVKMHVQMLFVVLAFSEQHVENLINHLKLVPYVGAHLQSPLKDFLAQQKTKLHHKPGASGEPGSTLLQQCLQVLVMGMILWFLVSIFNSLAQKWHKRLCDERKKKLA